MELTSQNVSQLLSDCFFLPEDPRSVEEKTKAAIVVRTVLGHRLGFDPVRLEPQKRNIASVLSQLPDEFMADKGGGMSFLNACVRKDGEQWGEHMNMDALFALGQAAGFVSSPMPAELSHIVPGGFPYFTVTIPPVLLVDERKEVKENGSTV